MTNAITIQDGHVARKYAAGYLGGGNTVVRVFFRIWGHPRCIISVHYADTGIRRIEAPAGARAAYKLASGMARAAGVPLDARNSERARRLLAGLPPYEDE